MIIIAQKKHFSSCGEKPASFWTKPARLLNDAFSALLRACLYAFRLLRPLLGPRACRFVPTCTQYAGEALAVHGPFYGSYLAARRVAKCHPFHPGGWDPVPPKTA